MPAVKQNWVGASRSKETDSAYRAPGQGVVLSLRPEFILTTAAMVAAIVLGGGTRSGFLSDAVLQLIAVPILIALAWRALGTDLSRHARLLAVAALALAAAGLLQLLPLPPAMWSALPGRAQLDHIQATLTAGRSWLPISLAPEQTRLALLSGLAPLAVLIGTLQLTSTERRRLTIALMVVGLASVALGVLQIAQGPSSALRFFASAGDDVAVGFFANRNHFSALLYVLMLIAAAWAIGTAQTTFEAAANAQRSSPAALLPVVASLAGVVLFIVAQTLVRSRAGIGLTIVAIAGGVAMALAGRDQVASRIAVRPLLAAFAIALILIVQSALFRIMERFGADPLADARLSFAKTTWRAALDYMPFGSGLGTFVPVYARHEPVADALANTFANHAHNDFLELWLETGVLAMIIVAGFIAWLAWRAWEIWRPSWQAGRTIDRCLARAASLVIALLLAHSLVDYPLRTSAMLSILAFAAGMLVPPPAASGQQRGDPTERNRRRSGGRAKLEAAGIAVAGHDGSPTPPAVASGEDDRPGGRWGADIAWPEAWQSPCDSPGRQSKVRRDPRQPGND